MEPTRLIGKDALDDFKVECFRAINIEVAKNDLSTKEKSDLYKEVEAKLDTITAHNFPLLKDQEAVKEFVASLVDETLREISH